MKRATLRLLSLCLLILSGQLALQAQTPFTPRSIRASRRSKAPLLYRLTVLARAGDPAPGGESNRYFSFDSPMIADDGTVAFIATLSSEATGELCTGVFTAGGLHGGRLVALEGQTAPGLEGTSTFQSFGRPVINTAGQVSFFVRFSDAGAGIYLDDALIAFLSGPVPLREGSRFFALSDPALNENGLVAFSAAYVNADETFGGGAFTQEGPLTSDADPIPELPGVTILSQGNILWLGDTGIAYVAGLSDDSLGLFAGGYLRMHTGDAAPDTVSSIITDISPGISGNANGDVAALVTLDNRQEALYLNHRLIACEDGPLPTALPGQMIRNILWSNDGGGTLDREGHVVFVALYGDSIDPITGSGVFLADRIVALSGQSVVNGNGDTLQNIASPATINNRGQITFVGILASGDKAVLLATPSVRPHAPPHAHP